MDERPDPQSGAQPEKPVTFSGSSDQRAQAQPQMPAPPSYAPPPLTPTPQAPALPSAPGAPGYPYPYPSAPQAQQTVPPPGPQHAAGFSGYGQPMMPPPNPSHPLSPAAPSQPSQPSQMSLLGERRKAGPLGRPFPLPLSLLIALGSVVLLVAVFGARVLVGGDWSDGAAAVGIVALALAIVVLLVALLRVAAGRRSLGFALLTILLLVGLAATGIGGLASSGPLHQVQAKAMEDSGQWSTAIHEYSLAGQKGPNAPDIARVHNSWGEQLLQQHDYHGALSHFQAVLDDYQQSGGEVARAQKDQFLAYAAWMKDDPTHAPYREAITAFVNYASNSACDSACKATLDVVTPQAYYLYGVQLFGQKRYQLAVTEFGKLTSQYGSSTYAAQAHSQAAAAYLAYGQQQIANQDCSGAVTSYTTLVKDYSDTPEADKAKTALKAPQNVSGVITSAPTNPSPTVHLSEHMNFNAFYFSNEYSTSIDPKTGAFTFKLVALGTYYITTSRRVSGGTDYVAWWADDSHTSYFSFTVTPLCPVQLGTFSEK